MANAGQPGRDPRAQHDEPAWRNDLSGVVHGPAVQAHAIENVYINAGAQGPGLVPRHLPPAPPNFTDRSAELRELSRLAALADEARGLSLVVIVAAGGSGKTALAARWAHSVHGSCDGGALFADLRGHVPEDAADPADIAEGFLRALGVPPERIPLTAAEQAAMFRSATTGKRMFVLLDNAASAAQVRFLLPGPGPERGLSSIVVVTTRWRIAGLAVDGGHFLELRPLDEGAALGLFDRMIGADRAAAEPGERRALVQLSGGLPLAICVIAAKLVAHPRWRLSRLAGELAGERTRLRGLSLAGDVSVRAAFDVAYEALDPPAKRAYRITSVIPGPDFDAEIAAAALAHDSDRTETRDLLDTLDALADACLLTEAGDRYQFHDLARLHALGHADAAPGEHQSALERSVDWYLGHAVLADFAASPRRWRLNPMYDQARTSPPAYPDGAAALDWLEARLPGLIAAVYAAHEGGLYRQAWQLCEALWNVFVVRKHFQQWISAHRVGLAAAEACDDTRARAAMHGQLGFALLTLQRFDEARRHFVSALELSRRDDHHLGEATALEQIGLVDLAQGAPDAAIASFASARGIHQRLGRRRGAAIATRRIGEAQRALGRYDDAERALRDARQIFAALPDPYLETRTLTSLAQTLLLAGRAADAAEPLTAALALATRLGSRYEQARITRYLGISALRLGDTRAARRHLADAIAGFEAAGAPDAEDVRRELAELSADR